MPNYCACSDAVRSKFGTVEEDGTVVCANCGLPVAADSFEPNFVDELDEADAYNDAAPIGPRRSRSAVALQGAAEHVAKRARTTELLGSLLVTVGIIGIALSLVGGIRVATATPSTGWLSTGIGWLIAIGGTMQGMLLCLAGVYARMRGSQARFDLLLNARRPRK